jgi:hypothetical protein
MQEKDLVFLKCQFCSVHYLCHFVVFLVAIQSQAAGRSPSGIALSLPSLQGRKCPGNR